MISMVLNKLSQQNLNKPTLGLEKLVGVLLALSQSDGHSAGLWAG